MKPSPYFTRQRGFTLMETVIAIGVLSVLLTGFLIVFIPAADGIKKSINIQDADRLVAAVEQELVTVRPNATPTTDALTGFARARQRIKYSTGTITANKDTYASNHTDKALLAYQYRGNPSKPRTATDGTPEPVVSTKTSKVGEDYILVPMLRRQGNANFLDDLKAVEGPVFLVKCVQMVNVPDTDNPGQFALQPLPTNDKLRGKIYDPAPNSPATEINDEDTYPDAVIAFAAEFYPCPSKAPGFFSGDAFKTFHENAVKPTFIRNLAIRR